MNSIREPYEVFNQPPELKGVNFYRDDPALVSAVSAEGGASGLEKLAAYGALMDAELLQLGQTANEHAPVFRPFDRFGHRINSIEFHPAYHRLMQQAVSAQLPSLAWSGDGSPGAHVVRSALHFLHCQADAGTACPLTMTFAGIPVLRAHLGERSPWTVGACSIQYDPSDRPMSEKSGLTIGMGMTERQGGSDVRANTTVASHAGGDEYELTGHKWFFSAPMSDAFLVLAQTPAGLTCFLLPRWRPDGHRNAFRLLRLKDKLGNRSNASSEVEFDRAWALKIGEAGRGVATIIEMVSLTRLDCMTGSAGLMRQALWQATHHARHRTSFGKTLNQHPLMQAVLADLVLESDAATALAMRVARAADASPQDSQEAAFLRIATAIGKYYVCKRAPMMIAEAAECLGGAGYIEESILPRLYREAPLNSIWEGCGNIQCLDVVRALTKMPATRDALFDELRPIRQQHPAADVAVRKIERSLSDPDLHPSSYRWLTELLAQALQASCLLRHADAIIFDAFCNSRFGEHKSHCFGALTASDTRRIAMLRLG